MSEAKPDRISRLVAEQILATIFGDDLAGCPVSLDQIAAIVQDAQLQRAAEDSKLIELFKTVVESILQVATPPESAKSAGPNELRSLLGERLDAVRAITAKTLDTIARIQRERSGTTDPEEGAGT
jgi:hypothetical protein